MSIDGINWNLALTDISTALERIAESLDTIAPCDDETYQRQWLDTYNAAITGLLSNPSGSGISINTDERTITGLHGMAEAIASRLHGKQL